MRLRFVAEIDLSSGQRLATSAADVVAREGRHLPDLERRDLVAADFSRSDRGQQPAGPGRPRAERDDHGRLRGRFEAGISEQQQDSAGSGSSKAARPWAASAPTSRSPSKLHKNGTVSAPLASTRTRTASCRAGGVSAFSRGDPHQVCQGPAVAEDDRQFAGEPADFGIGTRLESCFLCRLPRSPASAPSASRAGPRPFRRESRRVRSV